MKSSSEFFFWFRMLAGLMVLFLSTIWLFIRRPGLWASLQAWELTFWSRLVSPVFANKLERFSERLKLEAILKGVVVITAAIGVGGVLFFVVRVILPQFLHHKSLLSGLELQQTLMIYDVR
jgi:hypothetical protein